MASAVTSRDLECPVCHEEFRSPKMLPCGHTFCLEPCLQQLGHGKSAISCPECREQHDLPSGGVSGFPNNVFITRLLAKGKQRSSDPATKKICPICENTCFTLLLCGHCQCSICEGCRNEHTAELADTLIKACAALQDGVDQRHMDSQYRKWQATRDRMTSEFRTRLDETLKTLTRALEERVRDISRSYDAAWSRHEPTSLQQMDAFWTSTPDRIERASTQDALLNIQSEYESFKEKLERFGELVESVPEVNTTLDCDGLLADIRVFGDVKLNDVTDPDPSDVTQDLAATAAVKPIPVQSVMDRKIVDVRTVVIGDYSRYTGVTVSPVTGNVILADTRGVLICTPDMQILKSIETRDQYDYSFTDVVVNSKGVIHVLNTGGIMSFCENSGKSVKYNGPDARLVSHGCSFALDSVDRLHICCGPGGVRVLDRNLKKVTTYGDGRGIYARKIAVSGDKMYVTDVHETHANNYTYKMFVFNSRYQLVKSHEIGRKSTTVYLSKTPIVTDYGFKGKMVVIEGKYIMVDNPTDGEIMIVDFDWKPKKWISTQKLGLAPPKGITFTKKGDILLLYDNQVYYV